MDYGNGPSVDVDRIYTQLVYPTVVSPAYGCTRAADGMLTGLVSHQVRPKGGHRKMEDFGRTQMQPRHMKIAACMIGILSVWNHISVDWSINDIVDFWLEPIWDVQMPN